MEVVFEVHNQLGPGFTGDIYEKALVYELKQAGIAFEQQKIIPVQYKNEQIGTYRLDLVIDDKIILELKAISVLSDIHKQQVAAYLKAADLRLGIIINFGTKRVEYKRIAN